nr:hypothetical protein GCM10025699_19770 [Microbacterium flavescens]
MNLITLRRGEGLFVPAGVLHAYLSGLGVELMAASDNVVRGGLTPKHIDVGELLAVLEPRPAAPHIVRARSVAPGVQRFDVPVADFALDRVRASEDDELRLPVDGPTIALVTAGEVTVAGGTSTTVLTLAPGGAAFVTPDEQWVRVTGSGSSSSPLRARSPPPDDRPNGRVLIRPLSQSDTPSARRESSRGT